MLKTTLLITILPFSLLAQSIKKNMSGTYTGWWADTQWIYVFDKGYTFTFITAGHFGFSNTTGQYRISSDTIFLKSFPKDKQKDKNFLALKDTLLIDGDSCIINLHLGYDYCKAKSKNPIIRQSRQRLKSNIEARKPDE